VGVPANGAGAGALAQTWYAALPPPPVPPPPPPPEPDDELELVAFTAPLPEQATYVATRRVAAAAGPARRARQARVFRMESCSAPAAENSSVGHGGRPVQPCEQVVRATQLGSAAQAALTLFVVAVKQGSVLAMASMQPMHAADPIWVEGAEQRSVGSEHCVKQGAPVVQAQS
jgi:hypothetical protein